MFSDRPKESEKLNDTIGEVKSNTGKKKNLMSVIASLTPNMLSAVADSGMLSSYEDTTAQTPVPKLPATSQFINPSVNDSALTPDPVSLSSTNCATTSADGGGDVMTNILHLLYQVTSNKNFIDDSSPPENDESILMMQRPPEGKQVAIKQLMMSYANGTDRVRNILANEVNIMYECKQCTAIFRSLPNLIRHKTEFCTNIGLMSTILNRAANSSKEEDAAFQRVLDILHPPEPKAEIISFEEPPQPRFDPSKDFTGLTKQSNHVPSTKVNERNQYPVDYSRTAVSSKDPVIKSGPAQSVSNFGKFFIGRPTKTGAPGPVKPYACPICKKQMVERKSVRRHLVSIHSLSVVEAYKAMSNVEHTVAKPKVTVATSVQLRPTHVTRSKRTPPSETILRQCVEEINLGPSRTIHVLPQEFVLSSVQCPVCHRGLCRRTNVRRHLLEAHNLIIKGEKKYFQLKDIARNTTSNSPTLRRLRHLFTVTSKGQGPTLTDSRTKSLPHPIEVTSRLRSSPNKTKSEESSDSSMTQQDSTMTKQTTDAASKPNKCALKIETVHFVESESSSLEASASSNNDETGRQSVSSKEVSSSNESFLVKNESVDDEFVEPTRKSSQIPALNQESRDHHLNDDDAAEDEPPPKKLRQLAPMVSRSAQQAASFNGTLLGTATRLASTSSSNTQKLTTPISLSQIGANGSNTGLSRNENGVKNLFIRRISTDSSNVPTTTSSNGRTLIKVELRNSLRNSEPAALEKANPPKSSAKFDISRLTCFTCEKKFQSPPDIRRHLISVHSFTTEEALATCYDCSSVDATAQANGLKNGFDITNAKCLICKRFYFSRENLLRHMARAHHMEPELLEELKSACSFTSDETDASVTTQNHEVESKSQSAQVEKQNENASFQETITDVCTEEEAAQALKYFPKSFINASTLRCLKCKTRCVKMWNLKVHLLKHLGLGFFRCKYCPISARTSTARITELMKHFQDIHGLQVRIRDKELQQCRVSYMHLWEAYGLPIGKTP